MIHRWLLLLCNFSGMTFIKLSNKNEWKESKVFKFFGITKIISTISLYLSFTFIKDLRSKIFVKDVVEQKPYSDFSKKILNTSIVYFHICGLTLLIIQYVRRKKITNFFKLIQNYKLKKESIIKYQRACILNTLFNIGLLITAQFVKNFRLLRKDCFLAYFISFLTMQTQLIVLSLFNFVCNFKQFIVIALREERESLNRIVWNNKNLDIHLTNLMKIENCLEAFEENFGLQLTLITVNYMFSIVTFVSFFFKFLILLGN